MSSNKLKIKHEMKTLKELESELEELLSIVKPSEKLGVWDEFIVEKDINILWKKTNTIKEWSIIVVVSKIKWWKWKTDTIKYIIKWKDNVLNHMSKGVFIVTFCKDIISEEEEIWKKIKKIRSKIKEERDKIEWSKVLDESDKVQKKVGFLLRISKIFSKKI